MKTSGLTIGDTEAPVEFVEYGGLGCYLCNQYYRTIFPELLKYVREGSVQYRYRHYPLSTDGLDLKLNRAAECAARQDQFWTFREQWVTGPYNRSDTGLSTMLESFTVHDREAFESCLDSDESRGSVLSDRRQAMEDGIKRIPHFRIDSGTVSGVDHPDVFRRVLHEKLGRPWSPRIRGPSSSNLTVQDLDVDADTDHQVRVQFRYEYEGDTGRRTYLRLEPVDRHSLHFESSSVPVISSSGTATLTLTYGSYNPQHEHQTTRTEDLKLFVSDNEDDDYAQFHYPKKWTLHRYHPSSDTIPDDPEVNSIRNVRVDRVSPTEYDVTFDYSYRSDHGPHVFAGGSVLRDGTDASYSYRPEQLERGDQTVTIEIGRRESSIEENPKTDQIKLKFYVGGERDFFEKTVDRTLNWGKEPSGVESDKNTKTVTNYSIGNVKFMRELFKRYSTPSDVPDSFVRTYFRRGGPADYEWLFDRILKQFESDIIRKEQGYNFALRILLKIAKSEADSSNTRNRMKHLFVDGKYQKPIFEGRISRKTFGRLRELFRWTDMEDRLGEIRAPNVIQFDPENSLWQFPSSQLDKPIFFHVPKRHYLEYIQVRRPLGTLSTREYSRAYAELVAERGEYYLYGSTPSPSSGRLNRYFTQDYSVSLQSEPSWLALDFHQAEDNSYNVSVYVQAFKLPSFKFGPIPSDSGPEVVLDESTWSEELRALEWLWATDGDSFPENLNRLEPTNDSNMESIIRMFADQWANRRESFIRAHNTVDSPLAPSEVKVLQRYRSLVLPFLEGHEAYDYRRRTAQQKLALLRDLEVRNRYVDYEKARLHWVLGKFDRAAKQFRWLEKYVNPMDVLWPDIRFYRISSLYRARRTDEAILYLQRYLAGTGTGYERLYPGPARETFTELEGVFTQGEPRRNYLRQWLRVMQEGKRSWWYEQLGVAEVPVRYFRFFASEQTDEPIGKLVTSALRSENNAPIAYMNHKGMRGGIPEGPIRRNELFMVLPWNNSVKLVPGESPNLSDTETITQYLGDLPYPPSDLGGRGSDAVISSGSIGIEEIQKFMDQSKADTETFAAMVMPDYVFRRSGGREKSHLQSPRTDRESLEDYIEERSSLRSDDWR